MMLPLYSITENITVNLNGVIRTGFGIANFRYNFVKMLGNMFNIPCA